MVDVIEKPARMIILKDEPTEEEIAAGIALFDDFMTRVEARLSDGRTHAGGE